MYQEVVFQRLSLSAAQASGVGPGYYIAVAMQPISNHAGRKNSTWRTKPWKAFLEQPLSEHHTFAVLNKDKKTYMYKTSQAGEPVT